MAQAGIRASAVEELATGLRRRISQVLKAEITFERILGTFVPGALFMLGTWYLHRPFLLKYFPYIAGDPSESGAVIGKEVKTILFVIAALSLGLTFNHFSDIIVVCLFKDDAMSEKSTRRIRRIVRACWRLIGFTYNNDPRTRSITRYLQSPRKERFLKMMTCWASTDEKQLERPNESIIAHQHVLFRLRVLSGDSRKLLDEAQFPVTFSASLVCAFASLLPIALLSVATSASLDKGFRVYLVGASFGIYVATVLSSYSLKRQFRHFCHYVLTLALHCFELSSEKVEARKGGQASLC